MCGSLQKMFKKYKRCSSKLLCINLIDSSNTVSFSLSKCGSEVYCSLPFEKPRFFVWIALLINRQLNSGFTSKSQRFGFFIVLIMDLRNCSCFSCQRAWNLSELNSYDFLDRCPIFFLIHLFCLCCWYSLTAAFSIFYISRDVCSAPAK